MMDESGELSENLTMFKSVRWYFPENHIVSNTANYDIRSPSFQFANATWTLHVFKTYSGGWIRLGLERLESTIPQHNVECKFFFETNCGNTFEPCCGTFFLNPHSERSSMNYIKEDFLLQKKKSLTFGGVYVIQCEMLTHNIKGIAVFTQTELVKPVAGLTEVVVKKESLPSTSKGYTGISQHPEVLPGIKTLKDLKELFLKQEDCDVIIKVRGQEFPAHKTILSARSSVFASIFRNDMKEKATGVVDIEDCDPSSFSDFLCFLYCGSVEDLSTRNVFTLFTTADKYDVQDLRSECIKFMKENLSVDTFCDTITLALRHSEKELIELSTNLFAKNLLEIIVTVQWQSFLVENPIQSNELLIKALASSKK